MSKVFLVILATLVLVGALVYVFGYDKKTEPKNQPKIATTIFPLADIASNLIGDKMEVVSILPSGASPHTFTPTPRQVQDLSDTDVVFQVGQGLDDWAVGLASGAKVVDLSRNIQLLAGDHPDEENNPHYWLSVNNAKIIAETIYAELLILDYKNKNFYNQNLTEYLSKLSNLDQEIRESLADVDSRQIVTFHEAWPYYAKEYNLEVLATFEPSPGQGPSPRDLMELSRLVEQKNIKTVFSEPQLSNEVLKPFLSDLGLELLILDPLGGLETTNSYIELMRFNTKVISKALKINE